MCKSLFFDKLFATSSNGNIVFLATLSTMKYPNSYHFSNTRNSLSWLVVTRVGKVILVGVFHCTPFAGILYFHNPSVAGPILMIWSLIPLMGMEIPLAYGLWYLQILPPWSLGSTFRPSASTPALVTTPGGFSDPTGRRPVGFPQFTTN